MILHNVQHYVINHSHHNYTVMSMPMNVSLNLWLCCVILSFVHLGFSIYLNEPPVLSQDQVFKGSYNIQSRCHQKTRAFPVDFCGVCGTIATFTWLLCTIFNLWCRFRNECRQPPNNVVHNMFQYWFGMAYNLEPTLDSDGDNRMCKQWKPIKKARRRSNKLKC